MAPVMNYSKLKVFSGRANVPLAEKIARHLGDTLGKITLSNFPDGEVSVRIEEDVRGGAIAIVDKRRSSATETRQANLIGASLEGKSVVIFDDMISTAGSVVGAVHVAKNAGARDVYACATHAVLCGPAIERLRDAPLRQIVVTDSIPVPPSKHLPNLTVLSVAPLLGDAIKRIHLNESVSKLFE